MIGRRAVGLGDRGSKPPVALSKLRQYCSPHFVNVFQNRLRQSSWFLLHGVYGRGSKRSHTGKWKKNLKLNIISHPFLIVKRCIATR